MQYTHGWCMTENYQQDIICPEDLVPPCNHCIRKGAVENNTAVWAFSAVLEIWSSCGKAVICLECISAAIRTKFNSAT